MSAVEVGLIGLIMAGLDDQVWYFDPESALRNGATVEVCLRSFGVRRRGMRQPCTAVKVVDRDRDSEQSWQLVPARGGQMFLCTKLRGQARTRLVKEACNRSEVWRAVARQRCIRKTV